MLKKVAGLVLIAALVLPACITDNAQSSGADSPADYQTKTATDEAGYTYEYVTNDPLQARVYRLPNGLTVYLSQYRASPRIQSYITVKAGGKFDPATATGLAHYLEHMMFKGTHRMGTLNWAAEKPLLDSIERMFEHYRTLTDPQQRKTYYEKIDQVSGQAAKLAVANEYDKLCAVLGTEGVNAYTTEDRTVYTNDIPANELERFLQIEADRFGHIVNRLFHTELETVYEEKNRSLDNDYWKAAEAMNRALFKTHPYGTQTVIGTIEHLKNPSITEINRYFAKYYVPNNVAVCLSGDLEFAPTMKLIDQYFGKWERRDLPAYQPVAEAPLAVPQQVEVIGPDAEQVQVGFRLPGRASPDYLTAQVVDMMLANSVAGLIDLNLKQAQKVLDAGCYLNAMNDFTVHQFNGTPREGQTLDQVRDLLLAQIDSLKKGKFEDWLIPAVITDLKKQKLYSYEENYSRADEFVTAFSNEMKWQDYVSALARMKSIGRPQVIDFVNKHYQNNYAVVFKRTGKDPNAQKVEKPKITKVEINREAKSERAKALEALTPPRLKPQFLDYSKDLTLGKMDGGVEILYKQNQENDLFQLNYLLDMGSNHNPKFKLAVQYLEYLGSDKLSAVDLKKELYKLGCNFSVFAAEERVYVSLYGLDENLEPALQIFEDLLANPQPDSVALANMVAGILKKRDDDKKEKFAILYQGLMSYARYGAKSPFTNVLKNSELQTLKPAELTQLVQQLTQYQHQVLYYGKRPLASLTQTLNKLHRLPAQLKPVPAPVNFTELDNKEGRVFWTDYDMVQAEIVFGRSGQLFNRELQPAIRLYNEYMSGNMSSIAFQEIREAQGLAYSVWTSYGSPSNLRQRDYLMAYVGTQADKQAEAMQALLKIMDDMPLSENAFKTAKDAILSKIESERVIRGGVLFNYLNAKQLGLDQDLRQEVYQAIQGLTLADLQKFQQAQVKGAKYTVAVLADQDKINLPDLAKYGKVQRLTLEEIFGY